MYLLRAGFFPGAVYLCSYWYMPKDLATRISYFYCASALSGAFSGLLAAAIAEMDGELTELVFLIISDPL